MDQPYSRIADALLDYQYWSPRDPQQNVYDDTGWTLGELGNVQVVRVTDSKVLNATMERVNGEVRSAGGITGIGSVYRDQSNADNTLVTLRYRLRQSVDGGSRRTVRSCRKEIQSRLVHYSQCVGG